MMRIRALVPFPGPEGPVATGDVVEVSDQYALLLLVERRAERVAPSHPLSRRAPGPPKTQDLPAPIATKTTKTTKKGRKKT